MHLDLFTVRVMTQVTLLIVSLSTLVAWRINRPVEGMNVFATGLLAFCLGSAVGMLHQAIPSPAIVVLANALIVGGLVTGLQGVRQMRQFAPYSVMALTAYSVPIAIGVIYWSYMSDNYGMRVAIVSAGLALLTTDAAISMIRSVQAEDRVVYWPTGLAFAFGAVFLTVRTGAAILGYYNTASPSTIPIEIPLTICSNLAYVGCGFGMLLVANAKLRHAAETMALYDPLTNLPNRRVLLDRLLEAEHRAKQNGWRLGVIYLDLDGFKMVNDTLGHQAGDELLKNVSAAMTPVLGTGDCLARVGGDEFVVVVEDVEGRHELAMLAERLRKAVEAQRIPGGGGDTVRTSYGFAIFPDNGVSAHDVMREADSAMYHAKRQTRAAGQLIVD